MTVSFSGTSRADAFLDPPPSASAVPADRSAVVAASGDGVDRMQPPAQVAFNDGTEPASLSNRLSGRIGATVRRGLAIAARDGSEAVRSFLADPKNDALVLGGAAIVAGAQLVPVVNVGTDAALGITGAAMYSAAGREHQAQIGTALHSLQTYAGEVAGADTPAKREQAAHDLARFLQVGGTEGAAALGAVGGAVAAPGRLASLASKVDEAGGLGGVITAGQHGVGAATSAIHEGLHAAATWLDEVNAGLTPSPAFAGASVGNGTSLEKGALFARAHRVDGSGKAIRGSGAQLPTPQAEAAASRIAELSEAQLARLRKVDLPTGGEMPFEPPKQRFQGGKQSG